MLLLMSLSPAIIVHRCCWYRQKIYHRCPCHRWSLFSSVIDIRNKFIAGVVVTSKNCSAVSTTLVINLSPVSTLPVTENSWKRLIPGVIDTGDKFVSGVLDNTEQFSAGVVDTADKHSPRIFEVWTILMVYSGARGTLIYEKKLKLKISCQTPFKASKTVYCILSFLHVFLKKTLPVLFSPIFISECIKRFFVPEMEVTEIILAKVLRLCQLSNHSHGFFKSRGPSLWFSFLRDSKKGKNVLKLGPKKYVL